MANRATLEKELEMVKLEEKFLEAKAAGKDDKKFRDLKHKFHDARRAYREAREGDQDEVADGDAVAHAQPVKAKGRAKSLGSK